jgi:hypothetical protein
MRAMLAADMREGNTGRIEMKVWTGNRKKLKIIIIFTTQVLGKSMSLLKLSSMISNFSVLNFEDL